MPQLSPLNWILLFFLFWIMILLMSVLIWWLKKIDFNMVNTDDAGKVDVSCFENKWEC